MKLKKKMRIQVKFMILRTNRWEKSKMQLQPSLKLMFTQMNTAIKKLIHLWNLIKKNFQKLN